MNLQDGGEVYPVHTSSGYKFPFVIKKKKEKQKFAGLTIYDVSFKGQQLLSIYTYTLIFSFFLILTKVFVGIFFFHYMTRQGVNMVGEVLQLNVTYNIRFGLSFFGLILVQVIV